MSRFPLLALFTTLLFASVAPSARADDASGLNSRVCNNIALTTQERSSCKQAMNAAHTDDDRAKVRQEYEKKIVAARAKKNGG